MMNQKVSDFLKDIINAGYNVPADQLKKVIIDRFQDLITFDMAVWVSGHAENLTVHNTYLYNLPDNLMDSWENIKYEDRVLAAVLEEPGVTVKACELYTPQERQESPAYKDHSKFFGIEAVLSTGLIDPKTGLLDAISLYRRERENIYTDDDRRTKQFLFPFMIQIWHQNQIHYLKSVSGGDYGQASAICDKAGWIRNADGEFIGLLKKQWPGWTAPALPHEMATWLTAGSGAPLRTGELIVTSKMLDDLHLLQARPRGPLILLSAREEEIAEAFASGLSYKRIAEKLFVSPSTVRRHLENIYKKLGVSNKVELFQLINQG